MRTPFTMLTVLLLMAVAWPASGQALNPFEATFEQQLSILKSRVAAYQTYLPEATIPDELTPSRLEGMAGASTNAAARKLAALATRLDDVALGFLKKEIHGIGSRVKADPTTRGNL